ncbi:MAG: HAD-IIIC family phosphatase [Spirochaetaceae bacterium]|nr:HAD-IIIC family phosphatase [Spirochaetaceae bacterium]
MKQIKLVIWDLDNTFWDGVISECAVTNPKTQILQQLVNRGIVNSICSRNDFSFVKNYMEKLGVWDFFVFPHINWEEKGPQIKQIITDFKLRAENVLFIDDEHRNLQSAKFYVPEINAEKPEFLLENMDSDFLLGKNDSEHERLKFYKILEQKTKQKKTMTDEEFLYKSNIRVSIEKADISDFDRIFEMVHRTNQLNFTKIRSTKGELVEQLEKFDCGIINVKDAFGDYGVVGFYCKNENKLIHFLFSCRTIGMGIEKWVYCQLGSPEVEIKGEVVANLQNEVYPEWINQSVSNIGRKDNKKPEKKTKTIIMRGGCDLNQLLPYLPRSENIICEFNNLDFHRDHTFINRGCLEYNKVDKEYLQSNIVFLDDNCFNTEIYSKKYDVVIISVLMDYVQCVYHLKKNPALRVAYGDFDSPDLTEHEKYKIEWTECERQFIRDNLVPEGKILKEDFYSNLDFIYNNIGNAQLIIINGCEVPSVDENELKNQRHLIHKEFNAVIDSFIKDHPRACLCDMRKLITSSDLLTNNIRHYKRTVYYNMANELTSIIYGDERVRINSIFVINLCNKINSIKQKALKLLTILKFLGRNK